MSYEENQERIFDIQYTIDGILGCPTGIKRKNYDKDNYDRISFCSTIDNIDHLIQRSIVMNHDFGADMSKYDEMFFNTIDMLLEMNYTEEELKIINFYLYGRYNPDGTTNTLVDEETNEVILLESSDDLWNVLEDMKEKE